MWPLAIVQIPHTLQYSVKNKQTNKQMTKQKTTKTQFSWLLARMETAPRQQGQAIALG